MVEAIAKAQFNFISSVILLSFASRTPLNNPGKARELFS